MPFYGLSCFTERTPQLFNDFQKYPRVQRLPENENSSEWVSEPGLSLIHGEAEHPYITTLTPEKEHLIDGTLGSYIFINSVQQYVG